jgi:hypothetical protein
VGPLFTWRKPEKQTTYADDVATGAANAADIALWLLGPGRSVLAVDHGQRPAWIVVLGSGVDGRPGPTSGTARFAQLRETERQGLAARPAETANRCRGFITHGKERPRKREPVAGFAGIFLRHPTRLCAQGKADQAKAEVC